MTKKGIVLKKDVKGKGNFIKELVFCAANNSFIYGKSFIGIRRIFELKRISLYKVIFLFSLFFLFVVNAFPGTKNSSQIIKTGHWIYNDLKVLSAESKVTFFLETLPVSVGEVKFFLDEVDYENLSDSGKKVYDRIWDFLKKEDDFAKSDDLRLFANLKLNPELYYKSNADIEWSFFRNYKDNIITFPIILGFSDYFTVQADLFVGKNPENLKANNNISNAPIKPNDFNYYFTDFAYFSGVKIFDNWGISSHIGKEGMKIGNTNLGSVLYNDTFISDFYYQLNLFARHLKYSMDVIQFSKDKYFYIHNITLRPFDNFNIGVLEGSLITAPFELRFLNPLMIMHEFAGWWDYDTQDKSFYGESNFCAYFGLTFEYIPISNLRLYGLYAQNEILDFGDAKTPENLSMPDSIGAQLGAEYFIPLDNYDYIKTSVEAVYTSPFLYVKHSPIWSLIRTYRSGSHNLASWMGSPLGPDSFILLGRADYNSNEKLSFGLEYDFVIHGENAARKLFSSDNYINFGTAESPNWKWGYYPSVKFDNAKNQKEKDDAVNESRNMWMSGIREYKHLIRADGNYKLFDNLNFSGQIVYSFVINNMNKPDNFCHGIELAFAVTYELF